MAPAGDEYAADPVDAPAPGEPKDAKPGNKKKPNIKAWISSLDAAKAAAKEHWDASRSAWNEYLGQTKTGVAIKDTSDTAKGAARFPIYWSSTRTMEPALYSRTPIVVAEKVFDSLDDNIARLAGLAGERLAKYLMACGPFDETMCLSRDTYLHAAKTTPRVCYDAQVSTVPVKVYYTQSFAPGSPMGAPDMAPPMPQGPGASPQQGAPMPAGMPPMPGGPGLGGVPAIPPPQPVWVDDEGQPLPDGANLLQDERGSYVESTEESLDVAEVQLEPVHYKDILHTPNARHWREITWIAYRALMTEQDVGERWDEVTAKKLSYSVISALDDDRAKTSSSSDQIAEQYVTVWEIWDKRSKRVMWVAEGYGADFLEVKDDPYSLVGFFPSPPFMLGTCGPDDLYPVPDYAQLEPLINQMHGLAARLKGLIRASRRRGLVDGSFADVAAQITNELDEGEFISVPGLTQLVGEGLKLQDVVWFFPTKEISEAIAELTGVTKLFQDKYNEISGVPDILRGVSDARETAAAQQLKGKYLSLRFSSTQREFQRLVRDAIELMVDLALDKFTDDKLQDIIGVRMWEPDEQPLWPQVLVLLRDDRERKIRLDIETDSTITMNMNAEIEQRNYLAKTLFEGLQSVAQAGQEDPLAKQAAMHVLLYVIRGLQKGKEMEHELESLLEQMKQPTPQPPDPNAAKAQSDQAIAQMKIQADQQLAAQDAQLKQGELQLKAQQLQLDMQKLQMEEQKIQADIAIRREQLQIETAKVQQTEMDSQRKAALDAQAAGADHEIALLEFKLETTKVMLDEKEKYLTEARLQADEKRKDGEHKATLASAGAPPPITLHVNPQKPMKRTATIKHQDGTSSTVDISDVAQDEPAGVAVNG